MKKEYSAPELKEIKVNNEKENKVMTLSTQILRWLGLTYFGSEPKNVIDKDDLSIKGKGAHMFIEISNGTNCPGNSIKIPIRFGSVKNISICECGTHFKWGKIDPELKHKNWFAYTVFECPTCGKLYNGLGQELICEISSVFNTSAAYFIDRDTLLSSCEARKISSKSKLIKGFKETHKTWLQECDINPQEEPGLYQMGFIKKIPILSDRLIYLSPTCCNIDPAWIHYIIHKDGSTHPYMIIPPSQLNLFEDIIKRNNVKVIETVAIIDYSNLKSAKAYLLLWPATSLEEAKQTQRDNFNKAAQKYAKVVSESFK